MINLSNNTICRWVKSLTPKTWTQAAVLAGAGFAGGYYLINKLFPSKGVSWDSRIVTQIHRYEDEGEEFSQTPSAYFVQIPGSRERRIAILERIEENRVVIRYQDDNEDIKPEDFLPLDKAIWESWKGKKLW